ncbi:hypothetical protein GZ77_03790 [Endozoicomonas montiporae]|uniref:Uncharacterized protein n=2 Tax=Endozoicomonas montiporae TaxID=1027273 RepID=A0A081NB79_9GAMM|nr:hypothetical protein [Endozoicomonas montiporae]AMO56578.1 hypothetical protein EZMO1_2496 [Endozoicomonas montiporae CL-33]KEQ15702.1 hypothetical protein GZ77_03790 [Endozoicomonas montiporae]
MTTVTTREPDVYKVDMTVNGRVKGESASSVVRHTFYVKNCPCDTCPWLNRCTKFCKKFNYWVRTGKEMVDDWE